MDDDVILGRATCNKEDCNYYRIKDDKVHCEYAKLCAMMEPLVRCWDLEVAERAARAKRNRAKKSKIQGGNND